MNDHESMDATEHRNLPSGEIVSFPASSLVQRLEEAFGVLLPDRDLASAKTLDDLYRLILIELKTQPVPPPSLPFHRLRHALQSWTQSALQSGTQYWIRPRTQSETTALRPSTPLASLFPIRATRAADWKHLAALSALDLPPLRPFRWLRDSIRIATALTAIAVFVGLVLFTRPSGLLWFPPLLLSAFAGLVAYRSLFVATQGLVLEFPVRTLGELAQTLVERNPAAFSGLPNPPLTPEQVLSSMLEIAAQAPAPSNRSDSST